MYATFEMSSQSKAQFSSTTPLRVGDLLWCREGRKSKVWWPSMITYDPKLGIYFRNHGGRVNQYHVQYFGIAAVRGWVYVQATQELRDTQDNPLPCKGVSKKVRDEFNVALQEVSEALSLTYQQRKLKFIFSFGPIKTKVSAMPRSSVSMEQERNHSSCQHTSPVVAGGKTTIRKKRNKSISNHSTTSTSNPPNHFPKPMSTSVQFDNSPSLLSSKLSIPEGSSDTPPTCSQQQALVSLPIAGYVDSEVGSSVASSTRRVPMPGTKRRTSLDGGDLSHQQADTGAIPPPAKKPALDIALPLPQPLVSNVSDNGSEASAPSIASAILTPPSSCTGDPPVINFEFEKGRPSEEAKVEPTTSTKSSCGHPPVRKLKPVLGEGTCCICDEEDSNLLVCRGNCFRMFHLDCIGLMVIPEFDFICDECLISPSECFSCKKSGGELQKCSKPKCRKLYHLSCIEGNKLFTFEQSKGTYSFTCALHVCARCTTIGSTQVNHYNTIQCIKCPLALHRPDCLIAGCEILDHTHMICYQHLKIERNVSLYGHVNLNTCLECGNHGSVICCDVCSAAYHLLCLDDDARPNGMVDKADGKQEGEKTNDLEVAEVVGGAEAPAASRGKQKGRDGREGDTWKCPNCAVHDLPTYGSMVMSKFARWRYVHVYVVVYSTCR